MKTGIIFFGYEEKGILGFFSVGKIFEFIQVSTSAVKQTEATVGKKREMDIITLKKGKKTP